MLTLIAKETSSCQKYEGLVDVFEFVVGAGATLVLPVVLLSLALGQNWPLFVMGVTYIIGIGFGVANSNEAGTEFDITGQVADFPAAHLNSAA